VRALEAYTNQCAYIVINHDVIDIARVEAYFAKTLCTGFVNRLATGFPAAV
jgi:hypothetical protein